MRQKVTLEWNVPVEVTLNSQPGKLIENQYGRSVLYATADDKSLFVDTETSERIQELGLRQGESFLICKQKRDGKTRTSVWLSPATEKARSVTQAPEPAERPRPVPPQLARKLDTHPEGPAIAAPYSAAAAEFLVLAGRAMAQAEKVLAAEGIAVKFDSRDVAAMATTFQIQAMREGRTTWKPGEVA